MQVLDRYILKLWFAPFIGFFLVVNIVLLFGRLLSAIQAFGDNPIDGMVLAEMLFSILPYFLTLTLPFAFFFALLKVLSYLQENSESDGLLAAGISPLRILRPMFVLAILFWAFLTWTAMEWMPAGQRAFYVLYQAVQKTASVPNFTPGQFTQGFDGLTIYHAGEDDKGNMQRFMLEDKRISPATIYLAKQAHISRGNALMVLDMYDGVNLEGEGENLRATYFDKFSLSVEVEGLGIIEATPLKNQKPTFLGVSELLKRYQKKPTQALQAEWHRRWLLPSTIFILFLFAFPLSMNPKRSGKSKAWMWGIALMLALYNIQIVLHKKVSLGQLDVWVMWSGQLSFMFVGLILLYLAVQHQRINIGVFLKHHLRRDKPYAG